MMKRIIAVMLAVSAALPLGSVQIAQAEFGGNRAYSSALGPQVLTQGNPSGFRVGNGKEFAYRATASDADGIDRVEIYVNDARIKTCYSTVCEFRTTYWTNGATTRSIKFWTRATDTRGYSTENSGNPDYLTVDNYSSATADGSNGSVLGTTDSSASLWTSLDPNTTALNANQSIAYNVNAQDADGLRQIDVYANGGLLRSCAFNNTATTQTCSASVYGNNYSLGSNIILNAKATDQYGATSWTSNTTLYRSNDGSYNNGYNSASIWTTLDPNTTTLYVNQNLAFTVNAQNQDGIQRIEIFVNGFVRRSCEFGTNYGTAMCDTRLFANDYSQGTNITANARVTDRFGNATWSNTTTLYRAYDGYVNNNTNNNAGVSAWSWFEPSTLSRNASTQFRAGAWAERGLSSIELWVNGSVKRTCWFNTAYGNQSCDVSIYGNDYNAGSAISANAKATDRDGKVTWSDLRTITVTNDGTNSGSTGNANVSITSDRNGTFRANDQITFWSTGWDADGIDRVEIYVNAVRVRTCYGTGSCSVTVGSFGNSRGTVSYAATIFDSYGNMNTTGYKHLTLVQ